MILNDLNEMFLKICSDFEAELIEFDGEDDHVYLLVHYPPKVSISTLVNSLKGVSSRMIRQKEYPTIKQSYGEMPCGHHLILQVAVVAHLLILFANILSNKRHPIRITSQSMPYIPDLKDGVLRQFLSKL